jgi:arsenical pump membrane protein
LVAGLLVIGALAARGGLFERAGALAARLPGGGFALLVALLLLDALVTAVLTLDTAVVFLTPVLLHAARRRVLDEGRSSTGPSSWRTPHRSSSRVRT